MANLHLYAGENARIETKPCLKEFFIDVKCVDNGTKLLTTVFPRLFKTTIYKKDGYLFVVNGDDTSLQHEYYADAEIIFDSEKDNG